ARNLGCLLVSVTSANASKYPAIELIIGQSRAQDPCAWRWAVSFFDTVFGT
ncbi:MAG: hypothetical protein ACJAV4_001124, partial [Pontimonas sp.]